ncbi:MAG: hypothetical protein M0R76_01105 [Proteobacteria bacterium]|jgi:hypothetical protein|nr:hypothetical protein [Pseudomonadota bacterium]NLN61669.1 hypothetical protein [Myxococcales bacterium]
MDIFEKIVAVPKRFCKAPRRIAAVQRILAIEASPKEMVRPMVAHLCNQPKVI